MKKSNKQRTETRKRQCNQLLSLVVDARKEFSDLPNQKVLETPKLKDKIRLSIWFTALLIAFIVTII